MRKRFLIAVILTVCLLPGLLKCELEDAKMAGRGDSPERIGLRVPPESITINKPTALMGVGRTDQIYAETKPGGTAGPGTAWSSSDESVAVVSPDGVVTAMAAGTAIITAAAGEAGPKADCVVTVLDSTEITGITASVKSEEVDLVWEDPVNAFDHIEITWTGGRESAQVVPEGAQVFKAVNLANGEDYTFTVRSIGKDEKVISEVTVSATPVKQGAPKEAIYIYSDSSLDKIRSNLTAYYVLMKDIDLSVNYASGEGWEPIGQNAANEFNGTFDGNGKGIKGLFISRKADYQGFFGRIGRKGIVHDLGLHGISVSGADNSGGIAGENRGTIRRSFATGNIEGYVYNTGGIAGRNEGTIIYSWADTLVIGTEMSGGLAGYNYGTISCSYSNGNVLSNQYAGGLVGKNSGTVSNCFSMGDVIGAYTSGGLAGINTGKGTISYSYSAGTVIGSSGLGGLLGFNVSGSVDNCYFNIDGNTDNGYGTGISISAMKVKASFAGWDFSSVWDIDTPGVLNAGLPYLKDNAS